MIDVTQQLPEMGIGAILVWILTRIGALESRLDAVMSAMHITPKKVKRWRHTGLALLVLGVVFSAQGCGQLRPVTP